MPPSPRRVLVVLHVSAWGTSVLPDILSRKGPLPARHAVDGEPPLAGRVYVAPPDHHLEVVPGELRLTRSRTVLSSAWTASTAMGDPAGLSNGLPWALDGGTIRQSRTRLSEAAVVADRPTAGRRGRQPERSRSKQAAPRPRPTTGLARPALYGADAVDQPLPARVAMALELIATANQAVQVARYRRRSRRKMMMIRMMVPRPMYMNISFVAEEDGVGISS